MADPTTPGAIDESDERDIVPLEMLGRAAWLLAKIIVPLFVGAILVGFMFFDLKFVFIASFMGFVLMLFIALPLVLATFEDEVIGDNDH